MRRILLICASAAVLLLPAAASAGPPRKFAPGFLVVRNAGGGKIDGRSVVTVVIQGFVIGRVSPEAQARIDVYHLPGAGAPQAKGPDVSSHGVRWRTLSGVEYTGSGFRFHAIDGAYRVVVRGSGVYLFAGGHGHVGLRGSAIYPLRDGLYSVGGARFRSLPARKLSLPIGGG